MRTARLVNNLTPMRTHCIVLDDRHGWEQLVTIAKLTWAVSSTGEVSVRVPQNPVRNAAVANEGFRSIRYPHDICTHKPGTDVLLVGTVKPNRRRALDSSLNEAEIRLRIGDAQRIRIDKRVKVYGPRVWQQGLIGIKPGPAAPLGQTALIYENAYGGVDRSDPDNPLVELHNPLGSGVARDPKQLIGTATPCIEHPDHALDSRHPQAAGFGAIGASWLPRSQYLGTRDEAWLRQRAPLAPVDEDPRVECYAPADQHCDPPLSGDENVEVTGLDERPWSFRLPLYQPNFEAMLAGQDAPRPLDTHLDSYIIDADQGLVELTWRACVVMPRQSEQLRWVRVTGAPPLSPGLIEGMARKVLPRLNNA